jgi:hypothetical protein
VHKRRLEEARLLALEEEEKESDANDDLDPLNGEIGELIQKSVCVASIVYLRVYWVCANMSLCLFD